MESKLTEILLFVNYAANHIMSLSEHLLMKYYSLKYQT